MKNIPGYLFIFVLLLLITNCDDEFISRDFPSVLSEEAVYNPDGSVLLNGNLITRNSGDIEETGFVWQSGADPILTPGFKYILTDGTPGGAFSYNLTTSLKKNTIYYFRAYAVANGFTVYGELKSFSSTIDFALPVFHLTPESGQVGDTVTLSGSIFNTGPEKNIVKFENLNAEITSVSDSTIRCIVPLSLTSAESSVTITSDSIPGSAAEKFKLTKPAISGFTPSEAFYYDTIEITGTGFHRTKSLNTVLVGNSQAVVVGSTNTKLTIINPSNSDSLCTITVTVSGQSSVSQGKLKVHLPDFYYFSPASANFLETVTIKYKSVNPGSINSVWFGNFQGQILSITDSEIRVQVPSNLNLSQSEIKVNYGTSIFVFEEKFFLTQPYITGISETSVLNQASVVVTGGGFSSDPSLNKLALKNKDTGNEYFLTPTLSTSTTLDVTIYNHSNGSHLPSGAYQAGIKTTEAVIWSDQTITITDMWRRLGDFPGGERYKCAAFSINGKGYAGLGTKIGNDIQKDLWKYDPNNEQWSRVADFPGTARILPCVFVNSTDAFVGGGQSTDNSSSQVPFKDFYKYTPASNSWERVSDAPLVEKSHGGAFASPTENIHAANLSTSVLNEYNSLTNSWTQTYTGPAAENRQPQTFSINGKAYFVGGGNNQASNGTNNQVWVYDPASKTMTRKTDFPGTSRYGGFSFSIGNYGYIGCGVFYIYNVSVVYLTDIYRYDPSNDSWTKLGSYPDGYLHVPVSFVIGKKAYILTGYNTSSLIKSVWEFYDPYNN